MSSRCVLTEKAGAERDKGRGMKEGGEEGEDNTTPTHSHSLTGCNTVNKLNTKEEKSKPLNPKLKYLVKYNFHFVQMKENTHSSPSSRKWWCGPTIPSLYLTALNPVHHLFSGNSQE